MCTIALSLWVKQGHRLTGLSALSASMLLYFVPATSAAFVELDSLKTNMPLFIYISMLLTACLFLGVINSHRHLKIIDCLRPALFAY